MKATKAGCCRLPAAGHIVRKGEVIGPATLLMVLLMAPSATLAGPGEVEGAVKGAKDKAEGLGEKAFFDSSRSQDFIGKEIEASNEKGALPGKDNAVLS